MAGAQYPGIVALRSGRAVILQSDNKNASAEIIDRPKEQRFRLTGDAVAIARLIYKQRREWEERDVEYSIFIIFLN